MISPQADHLMNVMGMINVSLFENWSVPHDNGHDGGPMPRSLHNMFRLPGPKQNQDIGGRKLSKYNSATVKPIDFLW